jgi:hypothetical protein
LKIRLCCGVFDGIEENLGVNGLSPELLKVICSDYLVKGSWLVASMVTLEEEIIFKDNLVQKIFALREAFYQLQPSSVKNNGE